MRPGRTENKPKGHVGKLAMAGCLAMRDFPGRGRPVSCLSLHNVCPMGDTWRRCNLASRGHRAADLPWSVDAPVYTPRAPDTPSDIRSVCTAQQPGSSPMRAGPPGTLASGGF